jgi:hypothetical protein
MSPLSPLAQAPEMVPAGLAVTVEWALTVVAQAVSAALARNRIKPRLTVTAGTYRSQGALL